MSGCYLVPRGNERRLSWRAHKTHKTLTRYVAGKPDTRLGKPRRFVFFAAMLMQQKKILAQKRHESSEGSKNAVTRKLVASFFASRAVRAQKFVAMRHAMVVENLMQHLGFAPSSKIGLQHCWNILDHAITSDQQVFTSTATDSLGAPFEASLRNANFCLDLFEDCRKHPSDYGLDPARYLAARAAIVSSLDAPRAGRFRLKVNRYKHKLISVRTSGDAGPEFIHDVAAIVTTNPRRIFALRSTGGLENQTLLGHIVRGEEVVRDGLRDAESGKYIYRLTGRRVVLKTFEKAKYATVDPTRPALLREDPFKEICLTQYLQDASPALPTIIDVLHNSSGTEQAAEEHACKDVIIKVEVDAGQDLFYYCDGPLATVRIPDSAIASILYQLCGGVAQLHARGFAHLDLALPNTTFDRRTGRARVIDFGFVRRLPRDITTGSILPFPAGELKPSRRMTSAPELYEPKAPVDGRKVDVFALGSICFCLATKTFPFADAERGEATRTDPVWRKYFLGSRVGSFMCKQANISFGDGRGVSLELQDIVSAVRSGRSE